MEKLEQVQAFGAREHRVASAVEEGARDSSPQSLVGAEGRCLARLGAGIYIVAAEQRGARLGALPAEFAEALGSRWAVSLFEEQCAAVL